MPWSVALGAGRARAEDDVDPAAGIEIAAPLGARVTRGEPLAFVHASHAARGKAVLPRVAAAFQRAARAQRFKSRILERIGGRNP